MRPVVSCFAIVVLTSCLAAPAAEASSEKAANTSPAIMEAQADFNAGDYKAALQKISRGLSQGAPESAAGRYDLFMLRGECLLRLNSRELAIDAFRAAARTQEKDDGVAHKAAIANGTALLIQASRNLKYSVPGVDQPLDVVDPKLRKQALTLMFQQRFDAAKPKIDQAMQSDVLTPILDLLPKLRELFALEHAAKGEGVETEPMLRDLGQHARKLMTSELRRVNKHVDDVEENLASGAYFNGGYRGLGTKEEKELRETVDYLDKISKVAQQGRWAARRLGGAVEEWDSIIADCNDNVDHIQTLINMRGSRRGQ
jgi:hypothetical protein